VPDKAIKYTGRFAPTPSGPLHFGSVVAALGSFLDARSHKGKWLLRIEDIDTPRVKKGASQAILSVLERLGLFWDGEVIYQSQRLPAYEQALHALDRRGLIYACSCPRKLTRGKPYPGTCREKTAPPATQHALRVKTGEKPLIVKDRLQKQIRRSLRDETGDFIVKRSDALIAYHLALVVDDAWQNISQVVRGVDLWTCTPQQIYLQTLLALPTPQYCHLPIAISPCGRKISKTNHAQDALLQQRPERVLLDALRFLGQAPDPSLLDASVTEILQWGIAHWALSKIPQRTEIVYREAGETGEALSAFPAK